jgi:hypothetical protein
MTSLTADHRQTEILNTMDLTAITTNSIVVNKWKQVSLRYIR